MTRTIRSQKDFFGGLLLIAIGALALWLVYDLRSGTAGRMGPGYLPRLFAWGTIACGAVVSLRSFVTAHSDQLEPWPVVRLLNVLIPIVIFGYSVKPFGLLAAGFILCFLSALAALDRRIGEALAFAIVLPVAVAVLFIVGLKLPLPAWPDPDAIRQIFGS